MRASNNIQRPTAEISKIWEQVRSPTFTRGICGVMSRDVDPKGLSFFPRDRTNVARSHVRRFPSSHVWDVRSVCGMLNTVNWPCCDVKTPFSAMLARLATYVAHVGGMSGVRSFSRSWDRRFARVKACWLWHGLACWHMLAYVGMMLACWHDVGMLACILYGHGYAMFAACWHVYGHVCHVCCMFAMFAMFECSHVHAEVAVMQCTMGELMGPLFFRDDPPQSPPPHTQHNSQSCTLPDAPKRPNALLSPYKMHSHVK